MMRQPQTLPMLVSLLLLGVANLVFSQEAPPQAEQAAAERINVDVLRAHIRFLADDLLEGRGPGTRGDLLTQKYLMAQFEALGLEPAAPGGGFLQPFPMVGVHTHPPRSIGFRRGGQSLTLERNDDYVMTSGRPESKVGFDDAEVVFVGYGIRAPEYDWNDFKDVDVAGKVLLIMNNDPADDPELFAGRRRLYYGRWDYKYETAAKVGAVGALIIHTTPSAGYPYQVVQTSWSGMQYELAGAAGPRTVMNGWLTEEAARRLAEFSGRDLDELRTSAESRDFQPVPLGTTLSLALECDVREVESANVIAKLPGSDPELSREVVIFMAHHDHIGLAQARDETGDAIYNGAVDNASGVAAMLGIAEACTVLDNPPKRSILFAAVGAEEQGLLGSEYFAANPPLPAGYLAAVVNIDGVAILGPTLDLNVIGLGKSSMDDYVSSLARWQQRVVVPDQFPDRGYYYRSDQFSLAKVGVPGVYLHAGVQVRGKPDSWGRQKTEEWIENKYHQTSDEYDESWDLRGAVEDTRLLFHVGLKTANASEMPRWNPGDEFEAARKQAISERE